MRGDSGRRWLRALLLVLWCGRRTAASVDDWVAWRGDVELGPPDEARGWSRPSGAERFAAMPWEAEGPSGYRLHHKEATHYTLGNGSVHIEVWQPFPDTAAESVVSASFRGALYSLYAAELDKVRVTLVNKDYESVGEAAICRDDAPCPNAILLSDTQLPLRVAAGNVHPLDDFFAAFLNRHMRRLEDDFAGLAEYQYHLGGYWAAMPLMLDLRLLRFNKTTLRALGEELPPPHGQRKSWDWADFVGLVCKISAQFGRGRGLQAAAGEDEDFRLAMLMAHTARAYLVREGKCGLSDARFADMVRLWQRMLQEGCIGTGDGGEYWSGVAPNGAAPVARRLDATRPPAQGRQLGGSAIVGFDLLTGAGDDEADETSEMLYADMPGDFDFLGGSGLMIPAYAKDASCGAACSPSDSVADGSRIKEGWRILLELTSTSRPWLMQMNTMRSTNGLPPSSSMLVDAKFRSKRWRPALAALSRGIPVYYPVAPPTESSSIARAKPVRTMLLRALGGNTTAEEAIAHGCAVLDELVRPCNHNRWESDPRCINLLDHQQGCRAGMYLPADAAILEAGACKACPPGAFQMHRGVNSSCSLCPAGHFSAEEGSSTACTLCPAGKAANSNGSTSCETCPEGEAPTKDRDGCEPCKSSSYLHYEGSIVECLPCPHGKESVDGSSCQVRKTYVVICVLVVLLCPWLVLLVNSVNWHRVPIADVHLESGRLVVATCGKHRVMPQPWRAVRAHINHTGHNYLDGRTFRVSFKTSTSLYLLEDGGSHIWKRADTSMGELSVRPEYAMLGTGKFLPSAVWLGTSALALLISGGYVNQVGLGRHWVALAGAVSAVASVAYSSHRKFQPTPLMLKRQSFLQRLKEATPHPERCQRGPGRAISMGQLSEFHQHFWGHILDRDMRYVCDNLIKPLTSETKLSYAELAGPKTVEWFVSHFWGGEFREFVSSLQNHAENEALSSMRPQSSEDMTFWVCTFSNNQWEVDEELGHGDPFQSSFYFALQSPRCQGTCMVIDHDALPLKRSWCLFEVLQTSALAKERPDFAGLLLCTSTGVLQHGGTGVDAAVSVAKELSVLSLADATATNPKDKEMIDDCVRRMSGGFRAVNRFVRNSIKDALSVTHDSFQADFQKLVSALDNTLASERCGGESAGGAVQNIGNWARTERSSGSSSFSGSVMVEYGYDADDAV